MGLDMPSDEELASLESAVSVGGKVKYLRRKCQIRLINNLVGETDVFPESVLWVYPDVETQSKQDQLIKKFRELEALSVPPGGDAEAFSAHINKEKDEVQEELAKITNRLEVNILLGRAFFDNFKALTFYHHDREKEHECYFEYELVEGKSIQNIKHDKIKPKLVFEEVILGVEETPKN
jgi:hypothetical protein